MKSWLMTVSHSSQTAESMEIASNSPSCLELDPSLKWLNKLGEKSNMRNYSAYKASWDRNLPQ